ncbi:hypothetical protein [Afipia sp. DC4300-2b1]|uniref:hypothetical protein n=1 Tax=Afipia sp. DC4300-2b1 TaxID=2804672 RepID=UPI003CEAC350
MMNIRFVSLHAAALSALILSSSYALAQQSPISNTLRVRGAVESLDGETLRLKSRDGAEVVLHLPADAGVAGVAKISLTDVKVGSYIGVTSVPDADGSQKAVEVHVFPEAMRGTGDGTRPWDLKPNSSMTNGAVDDRTVTGNDGHTLTVKYKGGDRKVLVTPETTVVTFVPATRSEIKAGAPVFAIATKKPDGTLDVARLSIGRDGITPPM